MILGVRTRVSIIDFIIKKMRRAIAIVEDTDTASRNIAAGKYVLWKGVLTKASSAISSGTTLSSSNLTSLEDGAINDLDERISTIDGNLLALNQRLDCNSNERRSPKVVAWELYSQNKSGVYTMYCSSANADYSTLGYAIAMMIIGKGSSVLACIALSNNGKMYYTYSLGNTASDWTAWKAVTGS